MWPPKISAERISLANLSPPAPSKIRGPQTVAGACGQGKEAQEKKNQLARRVVKDAKAAGCPRLQRRRPCPLGLATMATKSALDVEFLKSCVKTTTVESTALPVTLK